MTLKEFYEALRDNGMDAINISINESLEDGYGIRKNYMKWEIFRRERGVERFVRGFPSESDALINLLEDIINHR